LIDEISIKTIFKLFSDKDKFIKTIRDSRNYYTHYDSKLISKAIKGSELFYLTEKLKIILIALILKESGFHREQIEQLFDRNEYRFYNHLIKS